MKYSVTYTKKFEKDYKRMKQRGKDLSKLQEIIDKLSKGEPLDAKHHEHILKGKFAGVHECHIEPDWLLAWLVEHDKLVLVFIRTGTHSDLFG